SYDPRAHEIVKVHDAAQAIEVVDDRHGHNSVIFHSICDSTRELALASQLRLRCHDGSHRDRKQIAAAFDHAAQITRGEHAFDATLGIDHDGNAPASRDHDDRLAHR